MGGIPWALGAHPDLCHPWMQKGVPEHEAALQHPALPPWHSWDSSVTLPVPLSRSQAPGDFCCPRGAGQTTWLQPCPAPDPSTQGSGPPQLHMLPTPSRMAASHLSRSSLPLTPCTSPSQERLQLNKLGPSWETMFRTDLAETYGPSCHDELEVGEDSLLHVLQVFLASLEALSREFWGTETWQKHCLQLQPQLRQLSPPSPPNTPTTIAKPRLFCYPPVCS